MRPVSTSVPVCRVRQARRVLVPCFSSSHSPAPHSFSPAVDQQVHGPAMAVRHWPRHLQRGGPAGQGGVVWRREIKPEQGDDGADQLLGLAGRQAEHGA